MVSEVSIERREMDQVIIRHRLQGFSCLAPGGEAADNDECVEASFSEHMRHPGARSFALSSTVDIDVLVLGQKLDLFV